MIDNFNVAHLWANNKKVYVQNNNLHVYRNTIESYDTIIGIRLTDKNGEPYFILDSSSMSNSTSKHQNCVLRALPENSKYRCLYFRNSLYGQSYENNNDEVVENIIERYFKSLANLFKTHDRSWYSDWEKRVIGFEESFSLDTESSLYMYNSKLPKFMHDFESIMVIDNDLTGKSALRFLDEKNNLHKAMLDYYRTKEFSLADFVDAVCGPDTYIKYYARTISQRKSQATKNNKKFVIKDIPVEILKQAKIDVSEYKKSMAETYRQKREEREKRRREREERERAYREYWTKEKAKEDKNKNLCATLSDEELREKWRNDEYNGQFYGKGHDFFFGGNVLLRLRKDIVETSKSIRLSISDAKMLWYAVINAKLGRNINGYNIKTEYATYTVVKFENDILTAGCHQIALCEMERMAKQLGFI